jgi:hypothetical protein
LQTFWNKTLRRGNGPARWSPWSGEEDAVGWVVAFLPVRVTEHREVCLEFGGIALGHVDASQHTTVIGPVVPVVEQADIPAGADGIQEVE